MRDWRMSSIRWSWRRWKWSVGFVSRIWERNSGLVLALHFGDVVEERGGGGVLIVDLIWLSYNHQRDRIEVITTSNDPESGA